MSRKGYIQQFLNIFMHAHNCGDVRISLLFAENEIDLRKMMIKQANVLRIIYYPLLCQLSTIDPIWGDVKMTSLLS